MDKVHGSAIRATLEKTNRILRGDTKISVTMVHGYQAPYPDCPSWAIGNAIYLNEDFLESTKAQLSPRDYMLQVMGLNYHELSHVLYTPRAESDLIRKIRARFAFDAFNILEDQRIETFFVATYQNAALFFSVPIIEHMVNGRFRNNFTFAITHGRRFLPRKVRDEVEKSCTISDEMKSEIKAVIDEYRLLPMTNADYERAFELVLEFKRLLGMAARDLQQDYGHSKECAKSEASQGMNAKDREKREVSESAEEQTEKQDARDDYERSQEEKEREESNSPDGDSTDDGEAQESSDGENESEMSDESETGESSETESAESESASGDSSDASDDSGDAESESDSESGESDGGSILDNPMTDDESDESESENENASSGGTSVGTGKADVPEKTLEEELQEVLEDLLSDETFTRELDNALRTVEYREGTGELYKEINPAQDSDFPVTGDMRMESEKIYRELAGIYDSVAPGWEYGQDEGRLNVGRYLTSEHGADDIFDRWDEGKEHDVSCEVFIGMDISGSMDRYHEDPCKALWAIKYACDRSNIPTTVIAYNYETRIMYGQHDKVSEMDFLFTNSVGGTYPDETLDLAYQVMVSSKNSCKLVIMITDGAWPAHDYESIISATDAVTVGIGIDVDPWVVSRHGFDAVKILPSGDLHGLADFMRECVTAIMDRAADKR